MSGHLERLKRLEMMVPGRAELSSPAAAWAAVLSGKGTPGLVARACRPYLAELQSAGFLYRHFTTGSIGLNRPAIDLGPLVYRLPELEAGIADRALYRARVRQGFGIGPEAKIAFGVSQGIFPVIVSTVAGVANLPSSLVTAARSMGASRLQVLQTVVLPHMVPCFFTGMRLGMTAVLLGVLIAELYVSTAGLGYYTRHFAQSFSPPNLFALIAVLAAIAVTLNELCRIAERRFSRWHQA